MRRLITSQRGFSLIETMMAFGILAVGMMAVASMISASLQFDRKSITRRDAYNIAMAKLEELKADPPVANGPNLAPLEDTLKGFKVRCEFNCKAPCAPLNDGDYLCCQQIEITVGWGDGPDCGTSDPSRCPNRAVFWNYIMSKVANQCL